MGGERLCTATPNICLLPKLLALLTFPLLVMSQSMVRYLPGFAGPLPFHLETGYIGVGESDEHQLFYYFVESERNPEEDPLLLWLNGGPGCTAWTGFVYEIGPLYYEDAPYDGSLPTLKLREHSWTKISSIIFLDAPAPTGFSFSTTNNYDSDDIRDPKEVYKFLVKWFIDHPQFLSNPLYIAGDSYSGLVLPTLVDEIANGIEAGNEPILNLKGYILGNPSTDRGIDQGAFVPHSYRLNLIPGELYEICRSWQDLRFHRFWNPLVALHPQSPLPCHTQDYWKKIQEDYIFQTLFLSLVVGYLSPLSAHPGYN
ncbi:hypothetical protein ACLOJK_036040 [Asimina triloba]